MNKPVIATALSLALLLPLSTGCTRVKSQRLMGIEDKAVSVDSSTMRKIDPAEAQKLAETLSGEIQTVYPSDNGLARVFGQVANLGETSYKQVRFDLVAKVNAEDSDMAELKVVGTFVVEDGLAPGDIKPFDVQTAASMGDVKNLEVMVGALR